MTRKDFVDFASRSAPASGERVFVPVLLSVLSDQLTAVAAYRRLVRDDERMAPSFLFESVVNGDRVGRYSIMGARPGLEVTAREHHVTVRDHRDGTSSCNVEGPHHEEDPLLVPRRLTAGVRVVVPEPPISRAVPGCLLGGWVGYASYDTVRYAETKKLGFETAPEDDRGLPDLHFCFYDQVVIFDHVDKLIHIVKLVELKDGADAGTAYDETVAGLQEALVLLQRSDRMLAMGGPPEVSESLAGEMPESNMTRDEHAQMVEKCREYIKAGDIFQVVVGQRFRKESSADPFDVYRTLRATNPSPYMVYLQAEGCVLVASSPEILCRVERKADGLVLTNRPLAGTRRRGASATEDSELERELRADPKETAEHVMLVDLGRNDVGRVAEAQSVELPAVLEVERYSHVMHLSSTVTGVLREGLDCWDALRSTLPVGTVSGAPKIRAMQIIDEVESTRRGPYGGGFGYVTPGGEMDIALALRTIVAMPMPGADGRWQYDLQASGGIVYDSDATAEYQETVNKAAALARALMLAERHFVDDPKG